MKKKVLVVDDSEANRMVLSAIMSRLDLIVDVAEDGEEGVQKFTTMEPDIVFIDQIMPQKNGSDAIMQMKLIMPDTKTILMSALINPDDIKEIVASCGADEFLPKPISSDVISEVLRKYNIIEQ